MKVFAALCRFFGDPRLWLPLACAFLFLNLSRIDDGGTAANARFATLRAMTLDHSFKITRYADWTIDWAKTPDGHYYSNKAPGPIFAAFPLFWLIDTALRPLQANFLDEKGRIQAPRGIHKVAVSVAIQVIPFLFLSLLSLQYFYRTYGGTMAYVASAAALLFGNTAAILMNSYFGNPFAALMALGIAYAYLQQKIALASFFFGWLVLSEYSAVILLFPFAWLLWQERKAYPPLKFAQQVCLGASLPAVLWIWYHVVCFGGPFTLPLQFEVFSLVASTHKEAANVGGFTSLLPNPKNLYELILGPTRGLLFTQPWLLIVAFYGFHFFYRQPMSRERNLFFFSLASLLLLLWLNAGFPGWHGGGTPGPRYLAPAMPLMALFLLPLYAASGQKLRYLFWLCIGISLILRGLVYATWLLAPSDQALWPYYVAKINDTESTLRLALYSFIAFALAFRFWEKKASRT